MGRLALHSRFTRRSFMLNTAGAGLCAAASSALIALPAKAANYRGVVGDIKPRANDSALVDMIKLLPDGIGVIPVYLNLSEGTREEYGMRQVAAVLGILWAALNVVLALLFLVSSFTAKTAAKEGILAQLALLIGGGLILVFGALLARESWKLMSQRTVA